MKQRLNKFSKMKFLEFKETHIVCTDCGNYLTGVTDWFKGRTMQEFIDNIDSCPCWKRKLTSPKQDSVEIK
jgi:hypothetical protein